MALSPSHLCMSELNICMMLPSTVVVLRPFKQTDVQRPMNDPVAPVSPTPERKRKYDWSEHPNAPLRPILISRPRWT